MDLELLCKQLLRAQGFVQNGTAAKQLHGCLSAGRRSVLVNATQDAFFNTFGHLRMGIVLVSDRQIVEAILAILIHAAEPSRTIIAISYANAGS